MRIQIRNCVTDPKYKTLRRNGTPVFKPAILGSILVPGAVRVVDSELFDAKDVEYLAFLVKSGSCTAVHVGKGPVDFDAWLLSFPQPQETVKKLPDPPAEIIIEEPSKEDIEEDEESEEESTTLYTEKDLSSMKNADLRAIAISIDPQAPTGNKSKKKLIALILELQNA